VPHWPHESFHPHHIEPQARLALSGLQRHYHVNSGNIHEKIRKEDSVVILPVIQAGQFNIREEEACLGQLFDHLNRPNSRDTAPDFRPLLDLTSGYFGLFKSYKDRILRSRIPTRIICASPEVRFPVPSNMANSSIVFSQANGFYGSKGISSRLPEGYTWLEQRFMAAVRSFQTQDPQSIPGSVELREWNRHGWTYHAKGVVVAFSPLCWNQLSVSCIHYRHLVFTESRVSTHPHTLWFHKPQLALCPPGHRTVFCNARKFCDCPEEASARATRPEKFRRRLERRPEKCAAYHKNSSSAFERIPISPTL
jgi:hypothetical protein